MNPEDAPRFKEAVDENLDHLRPWMTWAMREPQPVEAKAERLRYLRSLFDQGRDYVFGIFDRDECRVLGAAGLYRRVGPSGREIAYWIHKDFIGEGLATEAASALVRVAFEVDHLERVEIHCDPRNERSAAIPRRLGFVHEATLRRRKPSVEGPLRDEMIFSLFAEQYRQSMARDAVVEAYDCIGRKIIG